MTQTFMRFLHFCRTEAYVQYLRSNDIQQQRSSDAYLEVIESEFFALDSEYGRIYALCNLLGLVNFWDEPRKKAKREESEDESKDESKDESEEESED